ncbi:cyclophilin-like fold protein [Promicromonospora panici]|uniref:cyclophilin-like fold protein n=1 Tax=Promicromonospora panici TaxID=2219658 RepID=UPI00101CA12E|nr:cyclophilin-like fold protein [Promicromonospora panici]
MRLPKFSLVAAAAMLSLLAACSSAGPTAQPGTASGPGAAATPSSAPPAPSDGPSPAASAPGPGADAAEGDAADDDVAGTIVRFTSDDAQVDVTIGEDTPAVRDFLSMLPLTLDVEELSGREKIAYLPRELDLEGTPGSDPEDGDLIYYTPWGNLGFYYNASGIEYSDQTLHLGTYEASRDELDRLEGPGVTIEVVRER